MSTDVEANLEVAETPLLPGNARKRWRVAGVAIMAFTLARKEAVVGNPGLDLTSVPIDAKYRLRVFFTALRSIMAFSRARDDDAITGNQNELQDKPFAKSPTDTVINIVEPDWLSNLVRSQSSEQLRQIGGVEAVAEALGTDTERGILEESSIACMRQTYGSNRIDKPPLEITKIVFNTIKEPIIIVLLICATISLVFGIIKYGLKGSFDGGSIFVAVAVVNAVTAYSNIWPKRQIFKLCRACDDFLVGVIRNGQPQRISVLDVVVGDVICLKLGDQVPADGLYIYGNSLKVDESKLTVESRRTKDGCDPFLLSGSYVVNGSARMLITSVGKNTVWGQMLSRISSDANKKTPLQMKLHKLAMLIAKVGLVTASLVLVAQLIRYFTGNMHEQHGKPEFLAGKTRFHQVWRDVTGILVTPFAIASTAIPEGLLLAVRLPFAYSIYRMAAAQKALVINLSALEEIGCTTVICTDERGNLTTNKLEISQFWFSSIAPNVLELLLQGIVSENTQFSSESLTEIEIAIRDSVFQQKSEDTEQIMRANHPIPHQKGDPEDTLAKCSHYYDENGQIEEISDDIREILKQKIVEMKSKCLQCIAFSYSDACEDNEDSSENFHPKLEERFTLIGFAGLTYQCPPEIKEAMLDLQRAGVNIKLVTRTELPAARAIAFECGILDPNQDTTIGEVIEGHDFQNFSEEERLEKSDKIRVMARASTLQRRLMVKTLKQKGHVVAVTGDSVGDADVLKEADVGLKLGIQGTNMAKENSDIIILNDNFDSITTVLRWGRGMYYKIQVFAQFQLTVSTSTFVIDFITAISTREPANLKAVTAISAGKVPFPALQALWVKLIMGILATLAITIQEPEEELQKLPCVNKTRPFITNIMRRNIAGQALYPIVTLLTIYFKGESFNLAPRVKDTMIFNTLVLWQLFTIFTTRRFEINIFKGIQREKLFWKIVGTIIFVQVVIIEVLKRFAGTERLNWMQWAVCIGLALPAWPIGCLARRINVPA